MKLLGILGTLLLVTSCYGQSFRAVVIDKTTHTQILYNCLLLWTNNQFYSTDGTGVYQLVNLHQLTNAVAESNSWNSLGIWGMQAGETKLCSSVLSTNAGMWKIQNQTIKIGNLNSYDAWWRTNSVGEMILRGIP